MYKIVTYCIYVKFYEFAVTYERLKMIILPIQFLERLLREALSGLFKSVEENANKIEKQAYPPSRPTKRVDYTYVQSNQRLENLKIEDRQLSF